MNFTTPDWDLQLFWFFNDTLRGTFLDYLMPVMSSTGLAWVLVVAAIVAFFCRKQRNWKRLATVILVLGISVGITDFVCNIIKDEAGRVRPYHALAGVHSMSHGEWIQNPPTFVQPARPNDSSFVSSHAANSMALTVCLLFLFPWTRPWLLSLPLFIGWSRMYLGKHYPLDVLGGYVVGALVAILVWYAFKAVQKRRS